MVLCGVEEFVHRLIQNIAARFNYSLQLIWRPIEPTFFFFKGDVLGLDPVLLRTEGTKD